MILKTLIRVIWVSLSWLELSSITLLLYTFSYLPRRLTSLFYFPLFRYWCKAFVCALGVDLKLHEKNHLPIPKQYILIANHPSSFEDVGIPATFPVHSLAKAEVADWWWAGRITVAAGTLYVQRESRESRRNASKQIIDALEEGKNIVIYPEGGCKGRRIFESFRYGAFDISLKTGIPILPVFLHYEAQDTFEWRNPYTLIQTFGRIIRSQNNRANIYQYDAIDPKRFHSKEDYNAYVHELYLQWQERYLD
ncbi:MAG: 1-acyl-sn-glycerol-3-phosphate acyltransferase [Gammaproteobacteria bacterium]|nr:1-acyl-sn-glycerol-3-phosphate acyltransferase [Gammaproteobacteria bacterium]